MKTRDIFENDIQISTKPETYNQHPDHEVQMARSDLYRAAQSSIKLHQMLKQVSEKQGLEGWVQAKITKAADYLESVYHYLDYEMRNPSEIEMEAAPVAPGAAPATPQSAQPAAVAAQNPAVAAAAAAKAAADAKKAKQAQIKALQTEIQAKQRQIADLTKSMNMPATVAEEYKLNYNVGDRVGTPLGNGTITAVSKTVNVDGKVKVKLDGSDESNVFKTTDLKHLEEMASAGASAAGGVASAMGGNGFANGGPGTLKRAKKPAKESIMNLFKGNPDKQGQQLITTIPMHWFDIEIKKRHNPAFNGKLNADQLIALAAQHHGAQYAASLKKNFERQKAEVAAGTRDPATGEPIRDPKTGRKITPAQAQALKTGAVPPQAPAQAGAKPAVVPPMRESAPDQLKGTDKPKKMQKPGVLNQPHPFKGKLVGGD